MCITFLTKIITQAIILLFIMNFNIKASIDDSLVAYYAFNGNANDASGNGNNGTVYGASLCTDKLGNSNSAYSFDGVNDYINIPNCSSLNITDSLTLACWVKSNDTAQIAQVLVAKTQAGAYGMYLNRELGSPNTFSAWFWINGDYRGVISTTVSRTGVYYHVAATYDGDTIKLYVNGTLEDTYAISGQIGTSNEPVMIGAEPSDGYPDGSAYMDGCIDEVRIYHRTLSGAEIQELSNY